MCKLEVALFIGFQGAGKSTFYDRRLRETHVLVSKDLLRNNRRPARRQQVLLEEALRTCHSVAIDNTNPGLEDRAAIIATARSWNARIVGYFFASPLAECLARNAARPDDRKVPEVGVHATARRLVRPSRREGFNELSTVRTLPDFQFDVTPYEEAPDETR